MLHQTNGAANRTFSSGESHGLRNKVDDMLIWAEDMDQLIERTHIILSRCREHNITISKKKLELGSKINFAGHIISADQTKRNMQQLAVSHDPSQLKIIHGASTAVSFIRA